MTKNFTPFKSKSNFLEKGGGKTPKISQKLNQRRFGSNFQGKLKPINDQSWGQKMLHPPKPKPDFMHKKGSKTPKISPKLNQLVFCSNFQGELKPINDQSW